MRAASRSIIMTSRDYSSANPVDPQVVRGDDRGSCGILACRFFDRRVDPYRVAVSLSTPLFAQGTASPGGVEFWSIL